jgi:hypothetical protein
MAINVRKLVGTAGFDSTNMVVYGKANSAGGGAGQSVTIDMTTFFTDQYSQGILPGDIGQGRYHVSVTADQPAIVSVTNKTNSGFNVVLSPPTASATIAAGTFSVHVIN